jgi:hypothetical protein
MIVVLLVSRHPGVYQLIDQTGHVLGAVVRPTTDMILGRGAGTVLLTR